MGQPTPPPGSSSYLDRINVIVIILTAWAVLFTRSAGVVYCALGAVMCGLGVKVLKKAVRQPRPPGKSQKVTYGMPSTHSAVMGYYACYILLSCLYLPLHPSVPASPALRVTLLVLIAPCSTPILVSRVLLGHHTWLQVAVGTICGMAFAIGWFIMWINGLNAYGQVVEARLNS